MEYVCAKTNLGRINGRRRRLIHWRPLRREVVWEITIVNHHEWKTANGDENILWDEMGKIKEGETIRIRDRFVLD